MIDLTGNFPNNSLAGVLNTGLQLISQNQQITFKSYKRFILPFDGYVFWVLDSTVQPLVIPGSFHYQTDQKQELDKTIGYQNLVFTTPVQIANFDDIQPDQIWIGEYSTFKFSFSSHAARYEQAGIWHYVGQAVYPEMYTQLIESVSDLPGTPIVNNSLPIWLSLNQFAPVYPSFLVPENIKPPYIVVDIKANDTYTLQPIPLLNDCGIWQLAKDKIRLVIYGFTSQDALNFLRYVMDQSMSGLFGIMSAGFVTRDGKHIQSELNVIAQQKFIELEISYNQQAVYTSAINYIRKVLPITVTEQQ